MTQEVTARVLIADDDSVVRDVVRRYLEHDGLEVAIARDGSEALRLLGEALREARELVELRARLHAARRARWRRAWAG